MTYREWTLSRRSISSLRIHSANSGSRTLVEGRIGTPSWLRDARRPSHLRPASAARSGPRRGRAPSRRPSAAPGFRPIPRPRAARSLERLEVVPHPPLAFEAREEGVPGLDGVESSRSRGVDQRRGTALVEERTTLGRAALTGAPRGAPGSRRCRALRYASREEVRRARRRVALVGAATCSTCAIPPGTR